MTEAELVAAYPRLWHMAHEGAWPTIRQHGLMSTATLVEMYDVAAGDRDRLLRSRRAESVVLARDGLPGAVLRDQKPMSDAALDRCLTGGLTPADWYGLLNVYTFFWLSRERVWRLLGARAYRDRPQTVLTIDTHGLVAACRERIRLSLINSGSTIRKPQPRGAGSFMEIGAFPFADRAATRSAQNNVVELLVQHSVPDVRDHVLAVHAVRNDRIEGEIWRSDRACSGDHP